MIRVDLKDLGGFQSAVHRILGENFLHLNGHSLICDQADRIIGETGRDADFADVFAERVLHRLQHVLVFLGSGFAGFLFLFGIKIKTGFRYGAELFAVIVHHHPDHKLIDRIGEVEDLIAFVSDFGENRELLDILDRSAACIVDFILSFLHAGNILLQGGVFSFIRRAVQQEILQFVLQGTVGLVDAVFQVKAEVVEELLIFLTLFFKHILQHLGDLCVDGFCERSDLAVLLQDLTGNVEIQIIAVHKTLHKPVALRKKILGIVENKDPLGVEAESRFIIRVVEIERCLAGNIEQGGIADVSLNIVVKVLLRILPVRERVLVKLFVVFLTDLVFVFLPERNHGVERFLFHGIDGFLVIRGIGNGFFDIHLDRITHIIAVLLYKVADRPLLEEFRVVFLFGIILELQGDLCAGAFLFRLGNRISVLAGRYPAECLIAAGRPCFNGHFFRDHECAVEADAELADNVDLGSVFLKRFTEFGRAGTRNCSEV